MQPPGVVDMLDKFQQSLSHVCEGLGEQPYMDETGHAHCRFPNGVIFEPDIPSFPAAVSRARNKQQADIPTVDVCSPVPAK